MPYEWLPPSGDDIQRLHLWPYRSLPRRGMVWFIGGTAALIGLPLLVLIGSPILWGVLHGAGPGASVSARHFGDAPSMSPVFSAVRVQSVACIQKWHAKSRILLTAVLTHY